jgi:DNA-directed RNA polymerase subunit RPC12/RpoP
MARERMARLRAEDPERMRRIKREWYAKNSDKCRALSLRFYHRTRDTRRKRMNESRLRHPEWEINRRLRRYGLSATEYETLIKSQNYSCAICKKPFKDKERPAVDHCHNTNVVRGILCGRCNLGIGMFEHSVSVLLEAAHYLNKTPTTLATSAFNPSQPAQVTQGPPQ